MRILGIDPSLASTGIVHLIDGKIARRELIQTKQEKEGRVGELERLFKIRDSIPTTVVTEVSELPMDLAVIEGLAFMARNTSALVQLSALNYIITEHLYLESIPFIVVAPTQLKKFVCGKGNAPKDLVLLDIYKRYNVSFNNDNLADAYVLSRMGEAFLNDSIKLTKIQKEVIESLKS